MTAFGYNNNTYRCSTNQHISMKAEKDQSLLAAVNSQAQAFYRNLLPAEDEEHPKMQFQLPKS